MGQITVEGIGSVEIEGDTPTEEEQQAILEFSRQKAETQDRSQSLLAGDPDDPDEPVTLTQKQKTRQAVEDSPLGVQFVTELTPATSGAVVGGAAAGIATRGNPLAILVGAGLGGVTGEAIGQKLGITPESDLNLGLSAAGPFFGKIAGGAARGVRQLTGFGFRKLPITRTALARVNLAKAAEEFESVGTKLRAEPRGPVRAKRGGGRGEFEPIPSGDLYKEVRELGVVVSPESLAKTSASITKIIDELKPTKAFPDVKATIKSLEAVRDSILKNPDGVSLDSIVTARQQIGRIAARAEFAGGVKLGGTKFVFSNLADDMDSLVKIKGLTGRAARKAKEAIARAKFEFAAKDLEQGVQRFIKDIPGGDGEGIIINVAGLQKWFRSVTNPKSKKFQKNFTDALGKDLPAMQQRIKDLAALGSGGSAAGPGSLVVRQRFATAGAVIGGFVAGGPGSAVGAVLGATTPEMLVGMFMSGPGSQFLLRAAKLGQGEIDLRTWTAMGTILLRSAGDQRAQRKPIDVPDRGTLIEKEDKAPIDVEAATP
jgi:hypothetical protein